MGNNRAELDMGIYYCFECDNYLDDDYEPGEDIEGELVCPSCAEQREIPVAGGDD